MKHVYVYLKTVLFVLFVLTAVSSTFADVVTRYNSSGTQTASGTDVGAVQATSGAAAGDVMKVSGSATHTTGLSYNNFGIYKFTIESATADVKQTVTTGTGRRYDMTKSGTYNVTVRDIYYQGQSVSNCIGLFIHTSNSGANLTLNLDNTTFNGFKATNYNGGVLGVDAGTAKINASNGVTFSNNWSTNGGAISATNAFTFNGDATFTSNGTSNYGGAIKSNNSITLTGSYTFSNNYASGHDGGALQAGTVNVNGANANSLTTFSSNYAAYGGGAIYASNVNLKTGSFTFTGNYNKNNSSAYSFGGAIYGTSTITIDGDKITFTSNTSKNWGGAIASSSSISIKGNTINFTNNSVSGNDGGAIKGGNVTITGASDNATTTFSKNHTAYVGGAICGGVITLSTGSFTFDGNYGANYSADYSKGGAIYGSSVNINGKTIKFTNNTNPIAGGAIYSSGNVFIRGESVTFSGNKASWSGQSNANGACIYSASGTVVLGNAGDYDNNYGVYTFANNAASNEGGAIWACKDITLNGKSFTFSNNSAGNWVGGAIRLWDSGTNYHNLTINGEATFTGNTTKQSGAAVYVKGSLIANQFVTFSKNSMSNTSDGEGGAITVFQGATFNKGVKFENNAGYLGGGIKAGTDVTFAGDNVTGTFTGNKAYSGQGNDIYMSGGNLTFQGKGDYSFDGGIMLANTASKTVINQAQVALSGRESDTTNAYQLQNVTVSNGGDLTVNLDNIDSITGTFELADNSSSLTLNVDENISTFSNTVFGTGKIFKTGEGTLTLNTTTGGYSVASSEFDVEAGTLLFQGEYTGDLVVGNGTNAVVLSPGITIGTLNVNGDVTFTAGSTLLLEQDSTGVDSLTATGSITFEEGSKNLLELAMGEAISGATYMLLENGTDFEGEQATAEYWNSLLTPGSNYFWNLSVDGNRVLAQIDPNAVPEPSTWALLILGFAVLMKIARKRERR